MQLAMTLEDPPPAPPARWVRVATADGYRLIGPGGLDGGSIRVREHVRPIRPAAEVVAAARAELAAAGLAVVPVQQERLITAEGEYAALARLEPASADEPRAAVVGLVYGQDSYLLIAGVAGRAEAGFDLDRAVRDLVVGSELGLGSQRHRRFFFEAPAGWQALTQAGATCWYPLDFPRRHSVLAVAPAQAARTGLGTALLDQLLAHADFAIDPATRGQTAFRSARGLYGHAAWATEAGGPRLAEAVVLSDGRFLYPVRLESEPDHLAEDRLRLERLVDSIEALPNPTTVTEGAPLMTHWV